MAFFLYNIVNAMSREIKGVDKTPLLAEEQKVIEKSPMKDQKKQRRKRNTREKYIRDALKDIKKK
jgi:hypothetical protein